MKKHFWQDILDSGDLAEILHDENSYALQRLDKSTRESITSLMDVFHQLDPDGSKGGIESIKSSSQRLITHLSKSQGDIRHS